MIEGCDWHSFRAVLNSNEARVWLVRDLSRSNCVEFLRELLSEDERQRADRRRATADQTRDVVCRAMLRLLLAAYVDKSPTEVRFSYSEAGKPSLACAGTRISFNLSHSGDAALYAITTGGCVGVDLEQVRDVPDAEHIVEQFFSPAERDEFRSIEPAMRLRAFFSCWTRKEAVCKAVGEGLPLGLDSFDVSVRACGRGGELLGFRDQRLAGSWMISELELPHGIVGALAVEGSRDVVCGELTCSAAGELLYRTGFTAG